MDIQQMLERLLAGQAKAEADQKRMQEKMDAKHEKMMAMLKAYHEKSTAWLGKPEASLDCKEPTLMEMESGAEHREVPRNMP
jgi:hypothetical protein